MSRITITSGHVKAALMKRFIAPEWALMFEVGDATGARHTRFADAVAMSLWPSRGLELHGIEIKVSRSDWISERRNPAKAETIAGFCDRWYLVTPPGVVQDVSEVPPAWGWLELVGDRFFERKKAEKTDATAMTRSFLAALLRRAAGADSSIIDALVSKRCAAAEARIESRIAEGIKYKTRELEALKHTVEQFEAASGLKIGGRDVYGFADAACIGRAVQMVRNSGVAGTYDGLDKVARELRQAAERIDKALTESGIVGVSP